MIATLRRLARLGIAAAPTIFVRHRKRGRAPSIAVHLHLYYQDLLAEFCEYLKNIPYQFDLYVTVVDDADKVADILEVAFTSVKVIRVENRGRDVGGLIVLLRQHGLARYDLVLKIHSKKSLNLTSYLTAIQGLFGCDVVSGQAWRRQMLDAILGGRDVVRDIVLSFEKDDTLGMVGAQKFLCVAPDANAPLYDAVCARLAVPATIKFFAGTMFWIRGGLLADLLGAGFRTDEFVVDDRGVEGTLEHCIERVFGSLVESHGMRVKGV